METWALLPMEVITYILSFLPIPDRKEASLVNHIWYVAAQDSLHQGSRPESDSRIWISGTGVMLRYGRPLHYIFRTVFMADHHDDRQYSSLDMAEEEENLVFNIPAASASLKTIGSLAQRRVGSVKMTTLDGSTTSRDVIKCVASDLGPHLRSLCLRGSILTESSFEELLLACPCLTALDLSGCNSLFMSGGLLSKEETRLQAGETLANLENLNLSGLRYLSDLTFNRFTGCCPRLAKVALARCHITFEFDAYYGSNDYNSSVLLSFRNLLRFFKERAHSLKALNLSGTNISSHAMKSLVQVENLRLKEMVLQACQDLTNEAVIILCQHQPHLTTLDLSGCSDLSDRAVLTLSSKLLDLQSLCLAKLPRITEAGFQGVSRLKHLKSLDVSECSLVSCGELVKSFSTVKGWPRLVSLDVAFCSLLQDSSVLWLAAALSKSLRVLDLSSCVALSNRSVQAIAFHLLQLTILRLAWCKELTDWGLLGIEDPTEEHEQAKEDLEQNTQLLIDLAKQDVQEKRQASLNNLTRLQELDLTACGKLTDISLAKIISFPELRHLSLSLVPNLTDTSLLAIARNCRSLEHLSLSHCVNLTDKGFEEAAVSLHRLQHLVVSGCNQLTPRTLKAVGQECQWLKSLDVSMCSKITMMDVDHFQSHLPPQSQTSIQSRFVGGADLSITL